MSVIFQSVDCESKILVGTICVISVSICCRVGTAHVDFLPYHKISDDHGEEEEGHAWPAHHPHAVPHGFNPFSAQHAEYDHKRVHEIPVNKPDTH